MPRSRMGSATGSRRPRTRLRVARAIDTRAFTIYALQPIAVRLQRRSADPAAAPRTRGAVVSSPLNKVVVAALAATVALAAACGGSSGGGSSGGTSKPLVIGISLSQSGDFSDPGHAAIL